MTYTFYKNRDEFIKEVSLSTEKLIFNLEKIKNALSEQGFIYQKDSYHLLSKLLNFNSRFERIFYGLLHESCFKAELFSSSSGYISARFGTYFLTNFLKYHQDLLEVANEVHLVEDFNKTIEKFQQVIQRTTKQASQETIKHLIGNICEQNKLLASVLEEALLIAGLESKIRLEPGTQPNYVVELKSGYSFRVYPYKFFLTQTSEMWYADNPKVLIIDGIVEKVSELDKILNKSMETKQPLVLISRGFSEEVIATLKANNDYGNFNILPVRLGADLESINIASDIAVVCGADVVSSLKGDMIYLIDYDTLPTVEFIRATATELTIENGKTRSAISQHIKLLLEKRSTLHTVEDIEVLIDERIKSLMSNATVIRFPNLTENEKEEIRVKIDLCLRAVKSLITHGFVITQNTIKEFKPETLMDEVFLKSISSAIVDTQWCPSLSLLIGPKLVGPTLLSVLTSKGIIEKEN